MRFPVAEDREDDAILDAAVDRAIENLKVPVALIPEMRKSLRLGLATHPKAQEIVRLLRARPSVQRSGVVGVGRPDQDEGHDTRGVR
jgi:hypothetical protein